ncbi:CDCA2 protein, partial [Podilymbus podiceps]|nr:CDCA2 protein [Podilymbus podiceps]
STIGLRGSPENNTLIQYLAQQRSSRQKEAFTQQVSPFKRENARLLKDKIDAFQTSFKSAQEAERETGSSGLSQNKVPLMKERNLDQWSEKFMSDKSGADLKENLTSSSKSDTKICAILSSHQDVTVTEPPAVAKEWIYEQHNPIESPEAFLIRDILEKGHGKRIHH